MAIPRTDPWRELTISDSDVMPLRRIVVRICPRWRIVAKITSEERIVAITLRFNCFYTAKLCHIWA